MPLDQPSGSPADWLRHARADLALARVSLPPDGLRSLLCFHAQQAAEKAIKAVLVHQGVDFPKIHSLTRLIDLLPARIPRPPESIKLVGLNVYATTFRYPGEDDEIDLEEELLQEAIRLATQTMAWAEEATSRSYSC